MAIQKTEKWGFRDGDPLGMTQNDAGLFFLLENRFLWVFPQLEKTFWTGGTTTSFEIQFPWKRVKQISKQAGKGIVAAFYKGLTIDTHSGEYKFLLNIPDDVTTNQFLSLANEIFQNAIGSTSGGDSSASTSYSDDVPTQIKKLADLRDAGILTSEEFDAKKADLLSKM
jgi:hypothetical protein